MTKQAKNKDWYFFYDSNNFEVKSIQEISNTLEKFGFEYNKCVGLGGASETLAQLVLWLQTHQYISGLASGVLSNYVYDILKFLYRWFKNNSPQKKIIPIVEIFVNFKDLAPKRLRATLLFRFDDAPEKVEINRSVEKQTRFLKISSGKEHKCSVCKKIIYPNTVHYIKTERVEDMLPICQFCRDEKSGSVYNIFEKES